MNQGQTIARKRSETFYGHRCLFSSPEYLAFFFDSAWVAAQRGAVEVDAKYDGAKGMRKKYDRQRRDRSFEISKYKDDVCTKNENVKCAHDAELYCAYLWRNYVCVCPCNNDSECNTFFTIAHNNCPKGKGFCKKITTAKRTGTQFCDCKL